MEKILTTKEAKAVRHTIRSVAGMVAMQFTDPHNGSTTSVHAYPNGTVIVAHHVGPLLVADERFKHLDAFADHYGVAL